MNIFLFLCYFFDLQNIVIIKAKTIAPVIANELLQRSPEKIPINPLFSKPSIPPKKSILPKFIIKDVAPIPHFPLMMDRFQKMIEVHQLQ